MEERVFELRCVEIDRVRGFRHYAVCVAQLELRLVGGRAYGLADAGRRLQQPWQIELAADRDAPVADVNRIHFRVERRDLEQRDERVRRRKQRGRQASGREAGHGRAD